MGAICFKSCMNVEMCEMCRPDTYAFYEVICRLPENKESSRAMHWICCLTASCQLFSCRWEHRHKIRWIVTLFFETATIYDMQLSRTINLFTGVPHMEKHRKMCPPISWQERFLLGVLGLFCLLQPYLLISSSHRKKDKFEVSLRRHRCSWQ